MTKGGGNYAFPASSAGLITMVSAAFSIAPGRAGVVFTSQPTTAAAGSVIVPAVQVTALDAFGNTVTSFTGSVTVAIAGGTGALGAQLSGTKTVTAANGVATFSDLSINKAATGYVLAASATGPTSVASSAFAIGPGAAARLAFTVQPVSTTAGTTMTPAIQVTVQDASGNTVTSATIQVTGAIGPNPPGGTHTGAVTPAAVNGGGTF